MTQRTPTWVGGGRAPFPSSALLGDKLPLAIQLACAGLGVITLVVVGAVGLRGLYAGRSSAEATPVAAASSAHRAADPAPEERGSAPDEQETATEAQRELRAQMNKDLQARRYGDFIAHLDQLLQMDPPAAQDRELRVAIVDVVLMRIMVGADDHAEKLFELLQRRMGTTGIDILYELVATRGASLASKRAAELLRDEDVRALGTPALRIAYELRMASCAAKRQLFERAGSDGDKRALNQLQPLNQSCGRRNRDCCLRDDPALKAAIASIKGRLP